jgi:phytoene dehydrogenase-like protein
LLNIYLSAKKGDFHDMGRYLVHVSPDLTTVIAYINAPFKNKNYWDGNRNKLADILIKTIEMHTIPGLSKHITYKTTATPQTLYRYTLNYAGSAYGWESTPSQLVEPEFRKPYFIRGLYLTGHWTTHGLGIPGVMYLGYDTAKMILRKNQKICNKIC